MFESWAVDCTTRRALFLPTASHVVNLLTYRVSVATPLPVAAAVASPPLQQAVDWCASKKALACQPRSQKQCPFNLNKELRNIFKELAVYHKHHLSVERAADFKTTAFGKTGKELSILDFEIESMQDAEEAAMRLDIKTNSSCFAVIADYVQHGKSSRLERIREDTDYRSVLDLCTIWDVGIKRASELLASGIKSCEALSAQVARDDADGQQHRTLTAAQRMGLLVRKDLARTIPRDEVASIVQLVVDCAKHLDTTCTVTAAGSHRRGCPESGDIDVLITSSHSPESAAGSDSGGLLRCLVNELKCRGVVTGELRGGEEAAGFASWNGLVRLPAHAGEHRYHRRLDLKFFPPAIFHFALLYFTGSAHFNRSMRVRVTRGVRALMTRAHHIRSTTPFG